MGSKITSPSYQIKIVWACTQYSCKRAIKCVHKIIWQVYKCVHSSLTQQESDKLEKIQKTCIKIIMGDLYQDYPSALELCGLQTLYEQREKRCLDFPLKCIKHPKNQRIFQKNAGYNHHVRASELFTFNFASTSTYRDSAVPFCQRLLNRHFERKT